jgi:hypothetical protein
MGRAVKDILSHRRHQTASALALCIGLIAALPAAVTATTTPGQGSSSASSSGPYAPTPVNVTDLFYSEVEGNDAHVHNMTCVSFMNVSDRPIKTIEFSFSYVDVWGTTLANVEVSREGIFSPGVLIQGPTYQPGSPYVVENKFPGYQVKNCWQEDVNSPLLYTVTASVLNVTYSDGTQWTSPVPPTGTTTRPINLVDLGLLSDDMQKVALSRGHPCYMRFSDGGSGHMEFWYYGCVSAGMLPAREVYVFLDGNLSDHSY